MKKLFSLTFALFVYSFVNAQFVYKIKADTVLITNDSCTAELNLENSTKFITGGFLFNKGKGRTEFRKAFIKLSDSTYIIGDTIVNFKTLFNTLGVSGINIYNSNGSLTDNRFLNLNNSSFSIGKTSNTNFHVFNNGNVWMGNGIPQDFGHNLNVDGDTYINGSLRISNSPSKGATRNIFISAYGEDVISYKYPAYGNIIIGVQPIARTMTNGENILIGSRTGKYVTGGGNVILGSESGGNITSGQYNMILGYCAGYPWASGGQHTTIGDIGYKLLIGSHAGTPIFGDFLTRQIFINPSDNELPTIPSSVQFGINSSNAGFLPPRLLLSQRSNIASPAIGLQVYQTDNTEGYYQNTSTGWRRFAYADEINGTSINNIFNSNGTLTNNRFIDLGTSSFSVGKEVNTNFHVFNNGNVWMGNGTPAEEASVLHLKGNIYSSTNSARSLYIEDSLKASTNNSTLVGIDIKTNFAANGFSSIDSIALRTKNANIIFGSGFGYGNIYGQSADGVMQIRTIPSTYKTQIILRPAGNAGGHNGNWWGLIEQDYSKLSILSPNYGFLHLQTPSISGGVYVGGYGSNYGMYIHSETRNVHIPGPVNIGGVSTDDSTAVLKLVSTTRGFLPPVWTQAQRLAIDGISTGLIGYQTDNTENLYLYKSTGWKKILTEDDATGNTNKLNDPTANGIVARTSLNTTVTRTLTGSNGISVSNGDGVAGNPTASLSVNTLAQENVIDNELDVIPFYDSSALAQRKIQPWRLGASKYVILGANISNNTTTFSNIGLSFSATANATYDVEIFGAFQSASQNTGIAVALKIPSGNIIGMNTSTTNATTLGGTYQNADNSTAGATAGVNTANTNTPVQGKFIFQCGATGGTVQGIFKSEVAGSSVTLQSGITVMKITRIN